MFNKKSKNDKTCNQQQNIKFSTVIIIVLCTAILTTFILTTFGFARVLTRDEYRQYKKVMAINKQINNKFYKKPDQKKLEDGLCKGLFYGLDDVYSSYYNKEEMKMLLESSSGKYVGVGMYVGADKKTGAIKVENIFEHSPANDAGVQRGDLILKVDGKSYTYQEMDIAVKNMRGVAGTKVKITFMRDGKILEKTLTRREIKQEAIKSKMLEDKIGYIDIKGFEEDTAKDFRVALENLQKQGMKALIIDVRDDGGGLLSVVQDISDIILGKSVIVYTKDNKGHKKYLKSSDKEKIDIPIVVLTNGNSASASEILTGAILDNKAGISIGTTTYGKGLVQEVVQLRDGSGFKLTTAQYFTPNGSYINEKGIKPTIEVKDKEKQLAKAIEYLKTKIK